MCIALYGHGKSNPFRMGYPVRPIQIFPKGENVMKKNKMMRLASLLLVAVLLTTSIIGGTFAKYVTTYEAEDAARVAYWGFDSADTLVIDLFDDAYDSGAVDSVDGANVIAPGTVKTATFKLVNATGSTPEVKYTLTVNASASTCDNDIKNNPNIVWQLDNGAFGTWDALITAINALSETYNPGEVPGDDNEHTVTWKWIFDENAANKETNTANNDVNDTTMGNKTTLDAVKLAITVTATQVD